MREKNQALLEGGWGLRSPDEAGHSYDTGGSTVDFDLATTGTLRDSPDKR